MQYFKQYKSGLRLVAKATDVYTVSLGIFVGVGSVMEDENTNGFSHFIEHLLFKGTPTRTAQQISEEMDNIGANL
ncbi:MAG: insulinase family protein, partial [Clostridia bacterium]|nr:insulinase family protein [Clostridia bacterium]